MMVNNTVIETFSTQSVLNLKKTEDPAQLLPSTALRRTGQALHWPRDAQAQAQRATADGPALHRSCVARLGRRGALRQAWSAVLSPRHPVCED